ncbi:MAG TPA: hypothetical protein VGR20_17625 [Acidimicrobiia bacterium]|jgi:hypothetical protein|nr:hypothetical protein [Acidimicrobiia bacterium]
MRHKITAHARGYAAAYLAIFATLGGTSYAAAGFTPGGVRTATLENAALTRLKPARPARSTDPGDGNDGGGNDGGGNDGGGNRGDGNDGGGNRGGGDGGGGTTTPPTDPAGAAGAAVTSNISARARGKSTLAKHGGSTDIPLSGNTWTQAADEVELLAGTVVISNPGTCTGGFGNALTLSVDGNPTTFAAAPPAFKAGTATIPFVIGTLSEPGRDTDHKLTAAFGNACTKNGEDYTVKDVKIDVLKFH